LFSISEPNPCDSINCSNCQIVPDKNGQAFPLCYCDPTKAIVNKTQCAGKFVVYVRIVSVFYSQAWVKRSHLGSKKKWSFKTGDLLKKVQFIWNFVTGPEKGDIFNTGDCWGRFYCNSQIIPDKNKQASPLCYCDPIKDIVNKTDCW